ncbi:MAG: biotin/lipoyl-binding protein [Bdellovibrionales bacterium]|nr:biotin/lipoyl-binding protein [Bdellovibrionales bacterium]
MQKIKLEINNKLELITYKKVSNKIYIHCNGESIVIEPDNKKKKKSYSQASSMQVSVVSPMPGQVTQVLVSLNQKVKKGDLLLSMEAMKMEYNFFAERDAIISALNCKVDDQVESEKILLELK